MILAAAILIGGYLRFANLATLDLSPDEGASWAAASAPSLTEVIQRQTRLNPGEFGLHDVALHFWMSAMGDGLIAMRALSALAGTLAIALVFFVVRELLALPPSQPPRETAPDEPMLTQNREMVAALAALLFAVNLVTIKYSREARMYPLALALVIAQVWFFLRTVRSEEMSDLIATAVLTGLAILSTFSTAFVLAPEGLYLILIFAEDRGHPRRIVLCAAAMLGGLILTAPSILFYLHFRGDAAPSTVWDWIPRAALSAPISLFNKATGTYGFPPLVALAALGVARGWAAHRHAIIFLLLWGFAPPLLLILVSYAIQPAFVERYLLSCFVPFFSLAAIGVLFLRPAAFRPGALGLVVALALAHVADWESKAHGEAWASATVTAAAGLHSADAIGVAPRYAGNVVLYYLRDEQAAPSVTAVDAQPPAVVAIVADTVAPGETAALAGRYPHLLAEPRGLVVRKR